MANCSCRGETFPETKDQNCGPIIILFSRDLHSGQIWGGAILVLECDCFLEECSLCNNGRKCEIKHLLKMTGIPWQVLCHDPAIVGWQEELGAPYYGG